MKEQRWLWFPALGKEDEVRGLLQEWVQGCQARGIPTALMRQQFYPEGGAVYVVAMRHRDAAEEEQRTVAVWGDPQGIKAMAAKLYLLLRQPHLGQLFDVMIPYQT